MTSPEGPQYSRAGHEAPPDPRQGAGAPAAESILPAEPNALDTAALDRTSTYVPGAPQLSASCKGLPEGLPEISEYEALEFVAQGGMGMVLKGRHRKLNRLAAIKLPLATHITCDADRERFLREAKSAARLRHTNICAIHDVGEIAGRPYIAMDFIHGETLKTWTATRQPTARQISDLLALLARAVGYAHEHGVIHRDLKPSNVMVDAETGQPVLMDFGLAKELSDASSQLTQSGQVLGTPAYMAPEQAAGELARIGPLSDVYGLGAILYELLCQRPPFTGTAGEVVRKVQTDEPPPPRKLNPRIHRDLETICLKALAKDRERRYPSAVALAEDLERFSAGEAILARREGLPARAWRRVRRSPWTAAGVLLVVVALGAASYLGWGADQSRRVTSLENAISAGLEQADWTPDHVREMESLVDRLHAADPAAGEQARQRLRQRHTEVVDRWIRETPSLKPEDLARIDEGIELVRQHDVPAALRLVQALEERLPRWESMFDLPASGALDAVFDPVDVRLAEGQLQSARRSEADEEPIVATRITSAGKVRCEVVFSPEWSAASELGLLLNANGGHDLPITALAASPDGRLLASGCQDGTAKLWDLSTGQVLATFGEHGGEVGTLAFVDDGRLLVSAGTKIKFWDTTTRRQRDLLMEGPQSIKAAAVSADGLTLAVLDEEGSLGAWGLADGRRNAIPEFKPPGAACLAVAPDGKRVATAGPQAPGQILELKPGAKPVLLDGPASRFRQLDFSHDGTLLISIGQEESTVHVWDAATGKLKHSIGHQGYNALVAASPREGLLASCTKDRIVRVWNAATGQLRSKSLVGDGYPSWLAFSSDGRLLGVGSRDGAVHLWDLAAGRTRGVLRNLNYGFRIRAPAPETPVEGAPPVALRTFAELRKTGTPLIAEIRRERTPLHERSLPIADVLAGPLRLVAQREGDRLTLQVNDLPPLVFEDVFPIGPDQPGVFAVCWPPEAPVQSLTASRLATRPAASPLERGDEFFSRGEFAPAAEEYRRQGITSAGTAVAQEARYKESLCLMSLNRKEEGLRGLQELGVEEGERWPLLAACELWVALLEQDKFNEADGIFESVTARYQFQEFVGLIPGHLRQRILIAYDKQSGGFSYYTPNPERVKRIEQAAAVDLLFTNETGAIWRKWLLLRTYRAAGRPQDALTILQEALADADPAQPNIVMHHAEELAWVLRELGRTDEALAHLDRWLYESPAVLRPQNKGLLLERARVLASLERWEQAEKSVDDYLLDSALYADPARLGGGYLVQGLLRERRGDAAGALASWRLGLSSEVGEQSRTGRFGGAMLLNWLLLSSLSGDMTEAEAAQFNTALFASMAGDSPAAMVKDFFQVPPSVFREMWRSPRGRALAWKLAFHETTFPENVSFPAMMVIYEMLRQRAFTPGITPDQDELAWATVELAWAGYTGGTLAAPQALSIALTWKGRPGPLGWDALAPSLEPELRGLLAYVFGQRCLNHLGQPEQARTFFETALADAPAESLLTRLAKEELDRMPTE